MSTGRARLRRTGVGCGVAAVIGLQICYPLLDPPALHTLTVLTVLVFAATTTAHAAHGGARTALVALAIPAGFAFAVEAIGTATGFPFGTYRYAASLGVAVADVPLVVPLAWAMMTLPCLQVARRAVRVTGAPSWAVVPAAGWLLAAWDVFLDPQMVAAGHWRWAHPQPGLPGVPGIPLTNYLGWLVTATLLQAVMSRLVPHDVPDGADRVLVGWTWLGSALANLAFFTRPAVAAWGLVTMGLVALPGVLGRGGRDAPAHERRPG